MYVLLENYMHEVIRMHTCIGSVCNRWNGGIEIGDIDERRSSTVQNWGTPAMQVCTGRAA